MLNSHTIHIQEGEEKSYIFHTPSLPITLDVNHCKNYIILLNNSVETYPSHNGRRKKIKRWKCSEKIIAHEYTNYKTVDRVLKKYSFCYVVPSTASLIRH